MVSLSSVPMDICLYSWHLVTLNTYQRETEKASYKTTGRVSNELDSFWRNVLRKLLLSTHDEQV